MWVTGPWSWYAAWWAASDNQKAVRWCRGCDPHDRPADMLRFVPQEDVLLCGTTARRASGVLSVLIRVILVLSKSLLCNMGLKPSLCHASLAICRSKIQRKCGKSCFIRTKTKRQKYYAHKLLDAFSPPMWTVHNAYAFRICACPSH